MTTQQATQHTQQATPARKPVWRTALEVLVVLAITGVMILGLLEIGLRLFAPQISSPVAGLFTPDSSTTYRLKPDAQAPTHVGEINVTYDVNSQGLREDRLVGPPPAGSARLLCLGDSFTFGEGVTTAQTFPHLLSGSRAAGGATVDSVNGGVPGYGTDNEIAWLRAYGWPLAPKVVLLAFYVGNDVRDNILGLDKTTVDAAGQLVETPRTQQAVARSAPTPGLKGWLERNSNAYVFLRNLLHPASKVQTPGLYTSGPHEDVTFFLKTPLPGLDAGWEKTLGLLDTLRAETQAHGVPLVVVVVPTRDQVEEPYWQEMRKLYGLTDAQLQRDLPQQKLAAWSTRTGAPLIDLLPGFQQAAGAGKLYFDSDPHWNVAGHALAAQLIRDNLVRLGVFSR